MTVSTATLPETAYYPLAFLALSNGTSTDPGYGVANCGNGWGCCYGMTGCDCSSTSLSYGIGTIITSLPWTSAIVTTSGIKSTATGNQQGTMPTTADPATNQTATGESSSSPSSDSSLHLKLGLGIGLSVSTSMVLLIVIGILVRKKRSKKKSFPAGTTSDATPLGKIENIAESKDSMQPSVQTTLRNTSQIDARSDLESSQANPMYY